MSFRIESQAEPIPGYKLIERLGGGGFGEVWKCEAPGGLHKAIKLVYGDLQTAGDEGQRAEQELKALSRVKTVRHPYILSLERYDIIDGQLLIVMELADRNLWDRFKECRSQGLPGIPREELLGYMAESAEALDLMNVEYQLQHLDIKPQNLFLIHNHVKVADFGLVKDLEGMMASVTGGVTPVYAAPETFDGWVSRFSDQYSLAIVYQELLTGQRPFAGANIRQLIMQHIQAAPDLSSLPAGDRQAIARALCKNPNDRHPSCIDLVKALRQATNNPNGSVPPANRESGPPSVPLQAAPLTSHADSSLLFGPDTPQDDLEVGADGGPVTADPGLWVSGPIQGPATRWLRSHESQRKENETPVPARSAPAEISGDGCLFPTLVIGLGQQGLRVLQRLRVEVTQRFGGLDMLPNIRLLYLDTDPEVLRTATRGDAKMALHGGEILLTRLNRPSHYLKPREGRVGIDSWFNPKMLYRIPRSQVTMGLRALGRLAFCDNYAVIAHRLNDELLACTDPEALTRAAEQTQLGVRCNRPRVYVVAGLGGGTGSGMFVDLAYSVRSLLKQQGYERPDVIGMFLLPAVDRNSARTLALGNAYAALTELNHFAAQGATFAARYHERFPAIQDGDPPFNRCIIVPLPEEADANAGRERTGMAGEFLYRDLCSPLGRAADLARAGALVSAAPAAQRFSCQAFGLYRLSWPRREMIQQTAGRFCHSLVQRWMSKDSKPIRDQVVQWVREQWDKQELGAECFIARLQEACRAKLDQPPDEALAALTAPLFQPATGDAATADSADPARTPRRPLTPELEPAQVAAVLQGIDELLGKPEEDTLATQPGVLAETLYQAAETLVLEWGQKLAEMVVHLIEKPEFRLAGAEEAIRQMVASLEQVLQQHEPVGKEFDARAVDAHKRIHGLLAILPQKNAKGNRQATALAGDLGELLHYYPKWRFQSLLLQQVAAAYTSLRGHLSDELREINFCRARLSELLRAFAKGTDENGGAEADDGDSPSAGPDWRYTGACRPLFPMGCRTLEQAVEQFVRDVPAEELRELDQKIQAVIRQQFTALVHVCLTASNLLKNLEAAMQREAEAFTEARLPRTNVAELFLEHFAEDEEAQGKIAAAFTEASSDLAGPRASNQAQIALLAAPAGPAGERLRGIARRVQPDVELANTTDSDDIVFYCEMPRIALADLEQLGPLGQEAYRQMASVEYFTPHSRIDILEWRKVSG